MKVTPFVAKFANNSREFIKRGIKSMLGAGYE